MKQPKNEKQCALLAWKTATDRAKLTPLLKAIGRALVVSETRKGTFYYAHALGRFSHQIAHSSGKVHGPACLHYNADWKGKWRVTTHDLEVYSRFEMWMSRYAPPHAEDYSCERGRIREALSNKRMQQAYDRYQTTGLRKEHCRLLNKALWEVDTSRGDWVSLFVQGKRPFGDSSRAQQIWEICGWKTPWLKKEDGEMTDAQEETAWDIFDELAFAATDAAALALKHIKR